MRIQALVAVAATCIVATAHAEVLTVGSEGPPVRLVQERLRAHGLRVGVNGTYTSQTAAAVREFQRTHTLPPTGRVDDATLAALRRETRRSRGPRRRRGPRRGNGEVWRAFERELNKVLPGLNLGSSSDSDHGHGTFNNEHLQRIGDPASRLNRLIGEAETVLRGNPRGFRSDVMVVIDYGVHSSLRRFFVIDRRSREIEGYRVGHGRASDPYDSGYAQRFSDTYERDRPVFSTSVGTFRTAETFRSSRLGPSLKLDGLSASNANSRSRGYSIYASPDRTRPGDAVPLGYGGPALDPEVASRVIEQIKGGVLVYAPEPRGVEQQRATAARHSSEHFHNDHDSGSSSSSPASAASVAPEGEGRVNYRGFTVSSAEVRNALQRLANVTGRTVRVTSGDRNHVPRGGSRTSLHLAHRAADFTVVGLSLEQAFDVLRQHRSSILTDGGYEVIWHRADTNTGGPHLHLGFRSASRGTSFKVESRGTYTTVN